MQKIIQQICRFKYLRFYQFGFALSLSLYANKISNSDVYITFRGIDWTLTIETISLLVLSICLFLIDIITSSKRELAEKELPIRIEKSRLLSIGKDPKPVLEKLGNEKSYVEPQLINIYELYDEKIAKKKIFLLILFCISIICLIMIFLMKLRMI